MVKIGTLDIELHEKDEYVSQRKYLVHGWDDVLWTDNLDSAIEFLRDSLIKMESDK